MLGIRALPARQESRTDLVDAGAAAEPRRAPGTGGALCLLILYDRLYPESCGGVEHRNFELALALARLDLAPYDLGKPSPLASKRSIGRFSKRTAGAGARRRRPMTGAGDR